MHMKNTSWQSWNVQKQWKSI